MPGSGAYSTRSAACAQASPDDDARLHPAGTITLFAALDAMKGKLIARTEARHTHVEWLRFLKQIDRETPKELDVHLIQDNYATITSQGQGLARPPPPLQVPLHADIFVLDEPRRTLLCRFDRQRDPSGSFGSMAELVRDIKAYLNDRNQNPRPYTWKAEGAAILEKINRARAALDKVEAA